MGVPEYRLQDPGQEDVVGLIKDPKFWRDSAVGFDEIGSELRGERYSQCPLIQSKQLRRDFKAPSDRLTRGGTCFDLACDKRGSMGTNSRWIRAPRLRLGIKPEGN